MASKGDLKTILTRIDGKGYKEYKDIEGSFDFGMFMLYIDHVIIPIFHHYDISGGPYGN